MSVEEVKSHFHFAPDDAQRAELDRRLEAHARNPGAGADWEDVKKRVGGET